MADVEKIRVYVVSSDEGPARFEKVYEKKVGRGEDYDKIIESLAEKDGLDEDFTDGLLDVSDEHSSGPTAGRDGLDINLGKEDGPIAIAIRLPKENEYNELEFLDPPIIEQKTNGKTGEKFIKSAHRHVEGGNRWASFVCKAKEANDGKLAKLIGELPDKPYKEHKHAMRVPFSYDIIDKRLDFATWVLPDHAQVKKIHKDSKEHILTHGGVHPYSSYYLTIDL